MRLNNHIQMAFPGLVLALACILPVPAQTQVPRPSLSIHPPAWTFRPTPWTARAKCCRPRPPISNA